MLKLHKREYIATEEDLKYELELELKNMMLYTSEEVLLKMNDFLQVSTKDTFYKVALAMRKDLWGGKISMKGFYVLIEKEIK